MNYFTEYSEHEKFLFISLGFDATLLNNIDPIGMYQIAVAKAFAEGWEGSDVEALRRAAKVLSNCSVYRCTEEFDKLISF